MKNDLMIFERKEMAVASSRLIAERFHKRHDNLLRSIEAIKGGLLKNEETLTKYFIYSEGKTFS